MANQIYALLVGINQYIEVVLSGCINDINLVQEWLTSTYSQDNLHIKRLTDSDTDALFPGRNDVIKAFEEHFADADNNDICLFYFAGHGVNLTAPNAFADDKGFGAVQALLCRDWKRKDSNQTIEVDTSTLANNNTAINGYIIDKELSYLIWKTKLDKPDLQFVLVTDCCHSGSATRGVEDEIMKELQVKVRSLDIIENSPDAKDYLGYDFSYNGTRAYEKDENGNLIVQSAPHIHFGAAKDDEKAEELTLTTDGTHHGAFTYMLWKTLSDAGGKLSYQQLYAEASSRLKNAYYKKEDVQQPVLNAISSNVYKLFLSNEDYNAGNNFTVYYSKPYNQWCVNAGLLVAVSEGDEVIIEVSESINKAFKVAQAGLLFSLLLPQDATDALPEMNPKLFYRKVYIATRKLLPATDAKSKWNYLVQLGNPLTQLKNYKIKVECATGYDGTNYLFEEGSADKINLLPNIVYPNKKLFPSFKLSIENTGSPILYFSFAYLDSEYNITAYDNRLYTDCEIAAGLSQSLKRIGLDNSTDQPVTEYLKVFMSATSNIPLYSVLQHEETATRGLAAEDSEAEKIQLDDWATATIGFQIPPKMG